MNNILIFRGGAIGDFVLTAPVFAALRQAFPDARIELVGYPRIAELARSTRLIDGFHSLDAAEIAQMFTTEESTPTEWRHRVKKADLVISYLNDPERIVRKNLEWAHAKQLICIKPLPDSGHAAENLLLPLAALGVKTDDTVPYLPVTESHVERGIALARSIGSNAVVIHPGSGSLKKNWPIGRFVELAKRIKAETHSSPLFLLGEAERSLRHSLASYGIPILDHLSLEDVACLLSACSSYVGNDSGITHLATAIGIPTVAIFGPSDASMWGPRGDNVTLLQAPDGDLLSITVDRVLKAVVT